VECRNCGGPLDPQRVELGYDYCLADECQRTCLKPVLLAAVGVNKAAEHYARAEDILPPPSAPTVSTGDVDEEAFAEPAPAPRATRPAPPRRVKSTFERLREKELELDDALREGYARFCRGDWTAREMDREHDRLLREFNQLVKQENIRYRSMLRKTTGIGR
jgi:hypothetical protein